MTVEPKRNSFGAHEDARMHRLWNPETKQYLHLSGAGETPDVALSWLGYAHQADTLRTRARTRGDEWPYRRRARNVAQMAVPTFDQADA